MDFFHKYKKYKQKNTKLLTQYPKLTEYLKYGGGPNEDNIKYTRSEYDMDPNKNSFPFYCDDEYPILCGDSTTNFGLCKKTQEECDTYTGEQTYLTYDTVDYPSRRENIIRGKEYGYNMYDYNNSNCSLLHLDASGIDITDHVTKIGKKIKIMTQNLWWSVKQTNFDEHEKKQFHDDFLSIRLNKIADIILKETPDIVCMQEVGKKSFDILEEKLREQYPYHYEIDVSQIQEGKNGSRKRDLETLCFSKYPVMNFKLFGVGGNLSYSNSMSVLEFPDFVVFNVYLQAGTRNSPGQSDLWFNYSRCRYQEYLSIHRYMQENNIRKPIIVVGDFNTNLNGNFKEWPELKAFSQLDLSDLWLMSDIELLDQDYRLQMLEKGENIDTINKKIREGNTEDTDLNQMRWNVKFEEKKYRIDGIFATKDAFDVKNIKRVGLDPIDISENMQRLFKQYRIPNYPNKEELIKLFDGELKIWPSDHFGVIAEMELK